MTLPSEYSERVTEFENARMSELEELLNGHTITPEQRVMLRVILRGQGYLSADLHAHIEDGGHINASRKTVATIIGGIGAGAAALAAGVRQVFG